MQIKLAAMLLAAVCAGVLPACSRQTAEEKGKELATEKIDMVKGIGEAMKEKGGQAAESLAHGAGTVVKGAGQGIDAAFQWETRSSSALQQAGLTVTRVQRASDGKVAIDIYLLASAPVDTTLLMIGSDAQRQELARHRIPLRLAAGEGRYETVELDPRTPLDKLSSLSFDLLPAAGASAH
jgi:hypothetical protein